MFNFNANLKTMKTKVLFLSLTFIIPIFINAQNQPPVAVNDTVDVLYNKLKSIYVRNNDYDIDGGNIIVDTVLYSGGSIVSYTYDRVRYTGAIGFNGLDSLQYILRDTDDPVMYDTAWVFIYVRQSHYEILDINSINAVLGKDANLFSGLGTNLPGFESPPGDGISSISIFSPWLAGLNDGQPKMNSSIFWFSFYGLPVSGPIMDDEWYVEYDEQWDRLWKITRWEIIYHMNHWADNNYEPIEVIANWPAHGDTQKGQAFYLAPFYDHNNDGIYNPLDGDFPEIKGDQAVFLIFNFYRPYILNSQAEEPFNLGVPIEDVIKTEFHGLFYAFGCELDSALEHSVFANIKYINRSNKTYTDTYLGLWTELDIGNASDDYIECDVNRNSYFGLNGDDFDESSQSGPGYGENLVAQSITFLKGIKMDDDGIDNDFGIEEDQSVNGLNFGDGIIDNEYWGMNHFIYHNNSGSPVGDPTNALEYYNYLQSIWRDGTPMIYGGTGYNPNNPDPIPARFMFPENSDPYFYGTSGIEVPEWTETNEGNFPADRRGLASTGPFTLLPYDTAEVDLAFVFARDYTGSGNLAPIPIMKERIDSIRAYYLAGQTPCNDFVISVEELEKEELPSFFSIYPNPFSDFITLDNQSNESMEMVIYNLLGKELMRKNIPAGKTRIDLSHIRDNALIIKAISGDRMEAKKLLRVR